jgi:hypothetical protein
MELESSLPCAQEPKFVVLLGRMEPAHVIKPTLLKIRFHILFTFTYPYSGG